MQSYLGSLRRLAERAMISPVTVIRPTRVVGEMGGYTDGAPLTWQTIGRVIQPSVMEEVAAQRESTVAAIIVEVPHDQEIHAGDQLVIDAVTYEVSDAGERESWKARRRLMVQVVQ